MMPTSIPGELIVKLSEPQFNVISFELSFIATLLLIIAVGVWRKR
jgi:hypothetical protein